MTLGASSVDERLTVPPAGASVPVVRHWLTDRLAGAPGDVRAMAALLTSEIVTNAVLHADTDVTVTMQADTGGLRVEVFDNDPRLPDLKHYGVEAATGRGLHVVSTVADRWGAEPAANGKVVWFELGSPRTAKPVHGSSTLEAPEAAGLLSMALLGIPMAGLIRAQACYDELFREFRLIVERDVSATHAVQGRLLRLVEELGTRFDGFTAGATAELAAAVEAGVAAVDLRFSLPPDVGPACARYDRLLDEAEAFCRSGELITLAPPADVVALRRWILHQFVDQSAGGPAVPWADSSWAVGLEPGVDP